MGQDQRERHHNDDLPEQREEDRLFRQPEADKNGLTGGLKRHHEKAEEVQM